MKLFTYQKTGDSRSRTGLFIEHMDKGIDLQQAYMLFEKNRDPSIKLAFSDMISLIASPDAFVMAQQINNWLKARIAKEINNLEAEGAIVPLQSITLRAPVPRPPTIRDFIVFEKHVQQSVQGVLGFLHPRIAALNKVIKMIFNKNLFKPPRVWYEIPGYYKGNPGSVIGHRAEVEWPPFTKYLDYELEIGIYIGRQGRDIPRESAREFIAGYTIYNDFSGRDLQVKEMQMRLGPTKSKDFDTGNVMGPFLVTPDELKDPYNLEMTARINGKEWSRGNSRDMHYRFEDLIAYVSQSETLYPGDFIGSGTVGNGCGLEHGKWLKPGDIVELEVEGLGILQNRVVRENKS